MSIEHPRSWAGILLDRPRVMGILNVTPDSFSDGGRYPDAEVAIVAGRRMMEEGADIVDVGGESTRPGAPVVPPDEEQARVVPVVRGLAAAGVCVSVDTRNASTMAAALDAGARIVNDVSALAHDPAALRLLANRRCAVLLMHMRGTPQTMNNEAIYAADVAAEVAAELSGRIDAALAGGIEPAALALDPGIGFAKLADHSIATLRGLSSLTRFGYPLVVGVSRKSFIGRIAEQPDPARRMAGSIAAGVFAVSRGASILRVHDIPETVQALSVWHNLSG